MSGTGFVQDFDNVLLAVGPFEIYWYGFAYTVGFAVLSLWLVGRRNRFGVSASHAVEAAIIVIFFALAGARLFDVAVYEWGWYRTRLDQIINLALGGLAIPGMLVGMALGAWVAAMQTRTRAPVLLDEIAVPACIVFALAYLARLVTGGDIGTPTGLPWGVEMPGIDGLRHPAGAYGALANLALAPMLALLLHRRPAGTGLTVGAFALGHGAIGVVAGLFRADPSVLLGLGLEQWIDLGAAMLGTTVVVRRWRSGAGPIPFPVVTGPPPLRLALLVMLLMVPLVMPSGTTQDHGQPQDRVAPPP
jgi:phosphatidylglycerol---prolipoprotein diacylglyceryl transferase